MFRKLISSKNLRRRVALIIFIFLAAPFAIYGISSQRMSKPAGTLFGKPISLEDYQAQRAWVVRQLRNQFGEASDALDQLGGFINQTVWDRLILLEEARREHVRVDDQELAEFIRKIPGLQDNGRFDGERYHRFLAAVRTTPQEFERHLRQDLTVEKLVNRIKASVTVSNEEVREAYNKANEQLTASILFFDPKVFTQEAAKAITEEAIRQAYDAHPQAYRTKEQIAFDYAGVLRDEIAARITVDDKVVEKFYQENLDDWPKKDDKTPKPLAEIRETVKQRTVDEQARRQLTNAALDLQDDLDMKKSFDAIVAERSLTKRSSGLLSPGDLWAQGGPEPAVLQAAAKLAEGEMSDLVKTDQGVYLVKLTKRVPSYVPPFEEVKGKVRDGLLEERARDLARTKANDAHAQLQTRLASGAKYEAAVASLRQPLSVSSWTFTRSGPIGPLGAAAQANEAAFQAAEGGITAVVEAPTGFAILHPEKRIPADASKFADAEAALRQETLAKRQSARAGEWLAQLRARAKLKSFVAQSGSEA